MLRKEGIYSELGDYHKDIDKKWAYYPVFLSKMNFIDKFFLGIPKNYKILDAGCGEGFLVEKFRKQGYQNFYGIDKNYSSPYVRKHDISKLPYKDKSFNVVLCLETLQYLSFKNQEKAVNEIKRVLKDYGVAIITIPNQKHFAARIFHFIARKWRPTDSKTFPVGDRSAKDYISLIQNAEFKIIKRRGWFPTNFIISSLLIKKFPDKFLWLYKLINFFAIPDFSYINLLICKKSI